MRLNGACNRGLTEGLDWTILKLTGLDWTKAILEDWNDIFVKFKGWILYFSLECTTQSLLTTFTCIIINNWRAIFRCLNVLSTKPEFRPRLIMVFKQWILLFKHHNIYFHQLFHSHVFPQNLNNITKNLLPNRP